MASFRIQQIMHQFHICDISFRPEAGFAQILDVLFEIKGYLFYGFVFQQGLQIFPLLSLNGSDIFRHPGEDFLFVLSPCRRAKDQRFPSGHFQRESLATFCLL